MIEERQMLMRRCSTWCRICASLCFGLVISCIAASDGATAVLASLPTGKDAIAVQEKPPQDPAKKPSANQPSASPPDQRLPVAPVEPDSQEKTSDPSERTDDARLFYNPKYDDSALPVRREEEWTPPPPIDWSNEGVLELSFDHLKFNIEADQAFEVKQLTLDLLKLRGRTIKIRGYIRPSFKEKDITRFVFVRDNQECCFGPGALLYDCIIVNMAPGQAVDFSTRPVSLEGRFALKPFRGPDKRVWAIFELNETVLK